MSTPQVRVGVGVFVLKSAQESPSNPTFLIGKRKGSHGAGTYALPGGHLEFSESPESCAIREVLEETGLLVTEPEFLTATNDFMQSEGKHYVTVFMMCRRGEEVEARVLEPEKCEGWEWCEWDEMVRWVEGEEGGNEGRKLFLPLVNLVRQRVGVVPRLGNAGSAS